jgi:hypothetical protein
MVVVWLTVVDREGQIERRQLGRRQLTERREGEERMPW